MLKRIYDRLGEEVYDNKTPIVIISLALVMAGCFGVIVKAFGLV